MFNMWPIKFIDGTKPDKKIRVEKYNIVKKYEENCSPHEFNEN